MDDATLTGTRVGRRTAAVWAGIVAGTVVVLAAAAVGPVPDRLPGVAGVVSAPGVSSLAAVGLVTGPDPLVAPAPPGGPVAGPGTVAAPGITAPGSTAADVSAADVTAADIPVATTTTGAPGAAAAVAVEFALAQIGLPYVWGGNGPAAGHAGFDCSGLTTSAYSAAGIRLPRTAHTQFQAGPRLTPDTELQPGDLVFFGTMERIGHVGMYIGGGRMVNASTFGKPVQIARHRYDSDSYMGATRPAAGSGPSAGPYRAPSGPAPSGVREFSAPVITTDPAAVPAVLAAPPVVPPSTAVPPPAVAPLPVAAPPPPAAAAVLPPTVPPATAPPTTPPVTAAPVTTPPVTTPPVTTPPVTTPLPPRTTEPEPTTSEQPEEPEPEPAGVAVPVEPVAPETGVSETSGTATTDPDLVAATTPPPPA